MDTVWAFISHPGNLSKITPPELDFNVLSDIENKDMYPGQIIEYYVSPLFGFTLHWVTEITTVRDKQLFVDEQRFGPYKFWHHQHILSQTPNGYVEMIDLVHYKLPFGFLGRLIDQLIVKKKLEHIFNFRQKKLEELFEN